MSTCVLTAKPIDPATYVLARDAAHVTWFLRDNLAPMWVLDPDRATLFNSESEALEYWSLCRVGNNALCRRLKESYVVKHRPLQRNECSVE